MTPTRTLDETLHRVGLVGAAADRRARPALRGQQGRSLLPALRDDALLARGRAGLPRRGRPERLPEAALTRVADDRLLVWTTTPWTLRATSRSRVVAGRDLLPASRPAARSTCSRRRACRRVLGEETRDPRADDRRELVARYGSLRRSDLPATRPPEHEQLPILVDGYVTTDDGTGSCISRQRSARTTTASRALGPGGVRPDAGGTLYNPVRADGTYDDACPRSAAARMADASSRIRRSARS